MLILSASCHPPGKSNLLEFYLSCGDGIVTTYEVAELLNLQNIRDAARKHRWAKPQNARNNTSSIS